MKLKLGLDLSLNVFLLRIYMKLKPIFKCILAAYLYETETRTGPILKCIIVAYLYETENRTGSLFKFIIVAYLYETETRTESIFKCMLIYKGNIYMKLNLCRNDCDCTSINNNSSVLQFISCFDLIKLSLQIYQFDVIHVLGNYYVYIVWYIKLILIASFLNRYISVRLYILILTFNRQND